MKDCYILGVKTLLTPRCTPWWGRPILQDWRKHVYWDACPGRV